MSHVEIIRHSDRDPWERGAIDGKPYVKRLHGKEYERVVRESAGMYAMFAIYRDMGPIDRSIRAVAEKTKRSNSYVTKVAILYEWTRRAEAWDVMQEQRKRVVQQQAIDEMNDRQARIAVTMFSRIAQRLVGDEAGGVKAIDPNTLGAKDIARLAEVATKMERVARGTESDTQREINDVRIRVAFDINPTFPGVEAGVEPPIIDAAELTRGDDEHE